MAFRCKTERQHRDGEPPNRYIANRFALLSTFPYAGRARDGDFGPGRRSLTVGEYVIVYRIQNDSALVLRVVHGRRDLAPLFDAAE